LKNYHFKRRNSKQIHVGAVKIGGLAPVSIQSMTNTKTEDVESTLQQIEQLAALGCEIIRVAIPHEEAAKALKKLIKLSPIPVIGDIHFDHRLALAAIAAGVDGIRINPGNIGGAEQVRQVASAAKERKIAIRVGSNMGSLDKEAEKRYGRTAQALAESALRQVKLIEDCGYGQIKVSVKASSPPMMIEANRLVAQQCDYPLHLGVTEAGTLQTASIKSAIGIGSLLAEGIGDTIRVSVAGSPLQEIPIARKILESLELRKPMVEVIACPTCGRTEIDVQKLAEIVEAKTQHVRKPLRIAVMGCVVNGPGEAKDADYGITGGKGEGLIFRYGKILEKAPENQLVDILLKYIESDDN